MAWQKGQSGNPLGAKLYQQKPVAFLARKHSALAMKTLADIIKDTKSGASARVAASQVILDRAYGKPASFSTGDTQAFKRAVDMTDDELAAIASGAKLTVIK
jgi:Family of unknown function (DUF5681)